MERTAAMMVSFDHVWLLPLALVLPVAAIYLLRRSYRLRRERLDRLGNAPVVNRLVPVSVLRAPTWRIVRLASAGLLIGVAAAGPRWGTERTTIRTRGIDMVLSLDASLSMLATDDRPNRLERMKQEVRRLRAMSPGDRVALLAFAGRSYVLSPLTIDAGALDLFLDNLNPTVVGQAGSSLARTIRQGVDLLNLSRSGADRAIIVMSDGEAFESVEEVVAEATRAKEEGISLVTVGFGTTAGATIPIRENDVAAFKKDENGQTVVSRYSPDYLKAAADAAGGTFIEAGATDKAGLIKSALSTLRTQARTSLGGEDRVLRYQWFLLPGLLLLLIDTLLSERRGKSRWQPAAAKTATAMLAFTMLGGCIRVNRNPEGVNAFRARDYMGAAGQFKAAIERGDTTGHTLYNYGTSLLNADSLTQAAEVLARLADTRDEELRYRSLFNLGLSHLEQGLAAQGDTRSEKLDAALATYKKVILMRPDDVDAKWNYELALHEKQGGGGGGGGGQSQSSANAPSNTDQNPQPQGGMGQKQAEQLLGSAAREERDVQAKKQKQNRVEPPPGGKDW
ncbi:MAG TPA: VWA domain-containing protein [Gemmatimonadaceae bacterium]|nr:VWA domain-containing protein [Gemmatimonadaceae bacterium]